MERGKAWRGYSALSKPLTIMGVERRWFLLSATLGLAMWNAINSIVTGGLIFGVLYGVGFWAWKQDPNMLEILRASAQFRARYDPGKWAAAPWTPGPGFTSICCAVRSTSRKWQTEAECPTWSHLASVSAGRSLPSGCRM